MRNNGQAFAWALKGHGFRAIVMLTISIEDPDGRSLRKYFGKMASYDPLGAPDLRLNFARILKAKGDIPPPSPATLMEAPGQDDPCWRRIDAELRRIVRTGAYGSWFGRVGFHSLRDGILQLSTPNTISADKLRAEFLDHIRKAAETAGEEVERVIITVRRPV